MSRVKKTKISSSSFSSKFTDFRAFLKNLSLEVDYLHISQLEIIPGRFVNFADFIEYIPSYLQQTSLCELFYIEHKQGYHPSVIYLFFTNLIYEYDDNSLMLSTLINGIAINLTPKFLGKILNILSHGLTLNEIDMNDEEVFCRIYLPGQGSPIANNKLQPIPRLIDRILAYNICPKIGSYNYYSHDLATCVHAIMAKLEVNWTQIMFDTLVKEPSTFLPYGAFLTHIFQKYNLT